MGCEREGEHTALLWSAQPSEAAAAAWHMHACMHSLRGGVPAALNLPRPALALPPIATPTHLLQGDASAPTPVDAPGKLD